MAKLMFALILAAAPAAALGWGSCQDFCNTLGYPTTAYVQGTAPSCSGDCVDCHGDICGPLQSSFSDGGHSCWTGSKQCCCRKIVANVSEKAPEVTARSCNDYCTSVGIKYGYVRGTAPACGAGPNDCCRHDYPGPQASKFSDGGSACWTGSKQCCCGTPAGQSGCPKPGLSSLSCSVVNSACGVVVNKVTGGLGCAELDVEGAGICEVVGLGPEDPFADACAVAVAGAIQAACKEAVSKGKAFTKDECKEAAGCGTLVGNLSVLMPVVV